MKNKILPIVATIIVIIAICVIIFIPKNKEEKSTKTNVLNTSEKTNVISTNTKTSQPKTIEGTLNDNGDLEIKLDELDTSNATFIKYISNGVNMELVAIKDSQNNIDVAFNTCQVCNGAPKAYFVQKNSKLICQNCGNSFSLKSIGASDNGCNPMTLSDEDVTKTDMGITISKEFLSENEFLFTNVAEH